MRNSFKLAMHRRYEEVMRTTMPELICPGHGDLIAMTGPRISEYLNYISREEHAFREAVLEPADHYIDLFWARMLPYVTEMGPANPLLTRFKSGTISNVGLLTKLGRCPSQGGPPITARDASN